MLFLVCHGDGHKMRLQASRQAMEVHAIQEITRRASAIPYWQPGSVKDSLVRCCQRKVNDRQKTSICRGGFANYLFFGEILPKEQASIAAEPGLQPGLP